MMIENLTLFSDASFCPDTKAAAGAFWARSDSLRAKGSFEIAGCNDSAEAELFTVVESLRQLAETPGFVDLLSNGRACRVVVVSDCLAVQDALNLTSTFKSPLINELVKEFHTLRERFGFFFKINHVKAHKGTSTPRTFVNSWCDKEARRVMRKARESLSEKEIPK